MCSIWGIMNKSGLCEIEIFVFWLMIYCRNYG
ncbi:hypothetical protein OIU79_011299, partial [Salix purpurea]